YLSLHLVNTHFCFLTSPMRNCKVKPVQFRHKQSGTSSWGSWNLGQLLVMVSISLLKNVNEPCSSNDIDTFTDNIVENVVHIPNTVETGNDIPRFCIIHVQFGRLSKTGKQPLMTFI